MSAFKDEGGAAAFRGVDSRYRLPRRRSSFALGSPPLSPRRRPLAVGHLVKAPRPAIMSAAAFREQRLRQHYQRLYNARPSAEIARTRSAGTRRPRGSRGTPSSSRDLESAEESAQRIDSELRESFVTALASRGNATTQLNRPPALEGVFYCAEPI